MLSTRLRGLVAARSGASRELVIFLMALAVGLFLVPPLVWLIGQLILGPYDAGGALALMGQQFRMLASGSLPHWLVALGPYVLLVTIRLIARLFRRS